MKKIGRKFTRKLKILGNKRAILFTITAEGQA
jgi:hypothetical protein